MLYLGLSSLRATRYLCYDRWEELFICLDSMFFVYCGMFIFVVRLSDIVVPSSPVGFALSVPTQIRNSLRLVSDLDS